MNIGVSTASFYPLETELALEEIGKAGIKNSEIFINAESELKSAFTDILLDIKNRYDMNITAIHPTMSFAEPFSIFTVYERRFYEALERYSRYSEVAAKLGAKYIIMHGGNNNDSLSDEEYCEKYMLIKQAALKNSVTVLQENVVKYRSGNIEFLRSMRDILGDEAEFCFDVKQSIRCGYAPIELYSEFKENIKHIHISDHSIASDCLLPLDGGFDFAGFFRLLTASHYKGSCMIEVYSNAYKSYNQIVDSYRQLNLILNQ